MLGYIVSFVFNVVHYFYKRPVIKRIVKKTIMGNPVDVTIDYYRNTFISSPLDTNYTIDYLCDNREYTLITEKDKLKDAIKYINSFLYIPKKDYILLAVEKDDDNKYYDISEKVKRYAGPYEDYYKDSDFRISKNDISTDKFCVLYRNFFLKVYEKDELLS